MQEQLRRVCVRLSRELDEELLDLPFDAIDVSALPGEAHEVLRHAYEAGVIACLRDVVNDDAFLRWVEETCTLREAAQLCTGLRRLLGSDEDVASDDPARLARVDPLPATHRELYDWAARYSIEPELSRPAHEALGDAELGTALTLAECARPQGAERVHRSSLFANDELEQRAERYLVSSARRQAALSAREALWHKRPEGPLRPLIERLVALLGKVSVDALHVIKFSPARAVTLASDTGICHAQLQSPIDAPPIEARVYLAGFEQRALHSTCTRCSAQPCLHARALAGRLLDACLSPEDRLHTSLARFVARPSWQLFFEQAHASAASAGKSAREQLWFALRITGERISVGVRKQTQGSGGDFGKGRLVAPGPLLTRDRVSDDDRALLELLAPKSRTLTASFMPVDSAVLRALGSHPRVSFEHASTPLLVIEETLEVRTIEQADGLALQVFLAATQLAPGARDKSVDYVLDPDESTSSLRFAVLTPSLRRLLETLASYRGVLPKDSFSALASYLGSLDKVARVLRPDVLLGREVAPPRRFLLRLVPLPDEGIELSLWMRPFALAGLWPPGLGPELVHGQHDGQHTHARRDLVWEKTAAIDLLAELRLEEDAQRVAPFRYRVHSTQEALLLLTRAARVADRVELEWAEQARKLSLNASIGTADLKVQLFKRGAFFFPEGQAQAGETRVAFAELLQAAQRNERFVRVGDGAWAEIEHELFERLHAAQLCVLDAPRVPKLSQAASAFWLKQLGDVSAGGDPESRALLDAAADRTEPDELTLPPALAAQLRDYQREGVRFLASLTRWAPGACLLDEMGLGKTVQSIALLVLRREVGPALVVCPTSLVDNWCVELARFAPELAALTYRGKERRSLLAALGPRAVLVVSYELLLRDRAHFDGLSFATQISDEAQVVKNARTLKARALASLEVSFRVALTGTPVENRLADLWSLFHLVAPGLLGSWPRFRARFAVPIERYDNRERAEALRELVAPFMLRREKNQVLRELPARTEVVQLVSLSAGERELYSAALSEARRSIGKHKRNDPARRVHVLAELTRLRQLACHPRLVIDDARLTSSKLAALLTLLSDVLPRGQRVLIFSQFVAHLRLVREALNARGTTHLWLDGATPATERSALVARFQAGEGEVFLISLKAGGTGLNLTAADYVVHMDPWWNPSAQDQASDRAHRIGQTRPVTVVKLVTENTIEERVLALHEHKRRLAATIVQGSRAAEASNNNETPYETLLAEPS